MPSEPNADAQLEIGHVLFLDIVGYAQRSIDEQRELKSKLDAIVDASAQISAAAAQSKLVRLPTNDGMALVFSSTSEAPIRAALEITHALKELSPMQLRMGIHTGPVSNVTDVNDRANIAGAGINIAQRVMDMGDAGHILVSKRGAEDLAHSRQWQPHLHSLGEVEAKHGVKIDIFNYYTEGIGNPRIPEKLIAKRKQHLVARHRKRAVITAIALLTVTALVFILRRGSLSNAIPEKSIAVLPLENLSDDKADAFFADGIQDDVLTSLATISDLKVISRRSVMQFRGANRNLRDIGHLLGVANILEGSVRRVTNRVLVTVQLIDALHDRHLWAERYDRTITDSIGLQGELATEIAHALRAKLDPEDKARLATRPTSNPEAYVLYLKARDKENTAASKEDAFAVDGLYGEAIALDPKFALALARQSIWNSVMYHVGRRDGNKVKAHALAAEALRLTPDLAEAHLAHGLYFLRGEKDFDGALKEFSIAARTLANDPEILGNLGTLYRRQGRWREALAKFQRSQELDPRNFHGDVALTQGLLRNWSAAIATFRQHLESEPNDAQSRMMLASFTVNGDGDLAAAKSIMQKFPRPLRDSGGRLTGDDTEWDWELFMLKRDFAAAQKILEDFPAEELPPPRIAGKTFNLACTALARGDTAAARTLFEKARPLVETAARDHPDDPRFKARLGLLYGYMGRKEDALRESRAAVQLCPESKDAVEGPDYLTNLALVYARTGEPEEAITLLEHLLTLAATGDGVTLANLRLSWKWDPLRSNPRFQKILAAPEPKLTY